MSNYFDWDLIGDDGEEVYVPPGSNGVAKNGVVFANDIGSCIGIGIHSSEDDEGYISHLDTVSRDREEYMSQLNVFMELVPELGNPEIALVGGSQPDVKDDIDVDFADPTARDTYHVGGLKNTTARILEENFPGEIEINYPSDQYTELYLDSQNGIEIVNKK